MSSAAEHPNHDVGYAISARCDGDSLFVTLSTGRVVREPIALHPWLADATPEDRAAVEVVDFGTALRWPVLDEELGLNTILGLTEEAVARAAGFTIYPTRPWGSPQPTSASRSNPSPSRRDRTK